MIQHPDFSIRRPASLVLVVLAFLLSGCYLQKTRDDVGLTPDPLASIEVGRTTRAEALKLLGPPTRIIKLLESESYEYEHTVEKRTGMTFIVFSTHRIDKQRDAITLIFDKQGIVQAVGSRFTRDEARFGMPWSR